VRRFFEEILRHSKGQKAGQPFLLLEWQRKMLSDVFGRVKPDGTRQYRTAYIELPKKQGKSTTLAGVALYGLVCDNEPGAEIYGAASDREQAGIIYREAASMVRASPSLSKRLEVIDSRKTIVDRQTNSFYRVLSADAFRAEGLNIHMLLFDELHAQRDRRLWDALRYGGAARRQPLILSITTAGYDRRSICWEQHSYAEKCIADPAYDPTFYGCIYAAPPDCATDGSWKDPKVWRQANPSLGETITLESFAADAREAEQSPTKLNSFLRYRGCAPWPNGWGAQPKDDSTSGRHKTRDGSPRRRGLAVRTRCGTSATVPSTPGSISRARMTSQPWCWSAPIPRTTRWTCCRSSGFPRRTPSSGPSATRWTTSGGFGTGRSG
jgi:phage terminase large subunit-like protein